MTDLENKDLSNQACGIYIHFPFCRKRCIYCDFFSQTNLEYIESYAEAVKKEAAMKGRMHGLKVDSIYLGGGTPSLVPPASIKEIIKTVRCEWESDPHSEVTIEVNPDDVSKERVEGWLDAGINRFSIGIQSFDDEILSFLGRRHDSAASRRSLQVIKDSGVQDLSLDLIYGIPLRRQSIEEWRRTLDEALSYNPQHISCYELTSHEGTKLWDIIKEGSVSMPHEDEALDFFYETHEKLGAAGYNHYEVSNYSLGREFRSRHNVKYWNHSPYIGLGAGAHSFIQPVRSWNGESVTNYIEAIEEGRLPVSCEEKLDSQSIITESLFLSVRTSDGLDLKKIGDLGFDLETARGTVLKRLAGEGLITIEDSKCIPTIRGMAVSDSIPLLLVP